jgi:hypothetical protein
VDSIFQLYIFFRSVFYVHKAACQPVGGINQKAGQNDGDYDQPVMDLAKGHPFLQVIHYGFYLLFGQSADTSMDLNCT